MADIEEEVKEQKLAEIMQEALMKNSYVKFLGIEFMEFRCKHTVARIPYKEQLLNPYGMLHGGSLYSAADIVAGGLPVWEDIMLQPFQGASTLCFRQIIRSMFTAKQIS